MKQLFPRGKRIRPHGIKTLCPILPFRPCSLSSSLVVLLFHTGADCRSQLAGSAGIIR